jgi:hypothetical protein
LQNAAKIEATPGKIFPRERRLSYSCVVFEATIENKQKEIFLTKANRAHSIDTGKFLNEQQDSTIQSRRMEVDNGTLDRAIERLRTRLMNRRRDVQARAHGLREVMEQKRITDFGSNVALVVGSLRKPAAPLAASVADLTRLEGFLRAVKLEKDLWVRFVDAVSAGPQLES